MTCDECGAPCQGSRCRQCEIERAHEYQAAELREERDRDDSGHSARIAQLALAADDGDLPEKIAAKYDEFDGDAGGEE